MQLKLLGLCAFILSTTVSAAQEFIPVDMGSHVYAGGWEHFVGGGIAAFDCNGDHLPELYAAGGENPATLFRNTSQRGKGVSFEQNTPEALRVTGVIGAYPLDVDSDGQLDLAVLQVGENLLLKGGPDCAFTPFENIGLASPDTWTTAFSATWEPDQILPTLAFGNYVDRNDPNGPFEACAPHQLYRPSGEHYATPQSLEPGYCTLSMLFTDWSRKGRQDLRVSNDRHYYVKGGQEQMWAMEAAPRLYSAEEGWVKHELWGMGIASRDLTGDGMPDVYLSSMGDQRMQVFDGGAGPTYHDTAYDFGITAHRPFVGGDGRPSTGWHVAFGDVQNDGLDDIFIAKGNVEQMPGSAFDDPNNLMVQGPDKSFAEMGATAGIATLHRSRGAALVDFDLDGRLDLAVVNRRANIEAYENTTETTGNWLGIKLHQSGSNPDAIGAWIELDVDGKIIAREITVGGGHASGALVAEHFGLGDQTSVRVRVIWTVGKTSDWVEISAGAYLQLEQSGNSLSVSAY